MRITITEAEFEAISFAEDLINTTIESADDDFAHDASVHCNCLLNLIEKLSAARAKESKLASLYQIAKKMYPDENPNTWRKLARKSLTLTNNEDKL